MLAIIETGGKQYKVEKGAKIEVEKLEGNEGDTIKINTVLLIEDGGKTKVGTPYIDGSEVSLKILEQTKADKIKVFKMKAKKRYERTQGHRQKLTLVEVAEIK